MRNGHVDTLIPVTIEQGETIEELRDRLAERERKIAELEERVGIDTLTDLPRRTVLIAILETQIKHRRPFAVIFADVDGLKYCNDRFGHNVGDELLERVAETISNNIREADGDMACRWGGDEFVVLLRNPESPHVAASRIRCAVINSVHNMGAGLSVGVSVFPEDGSTSAELIRVADSRMYANKDTNKRR